MRFVSILIVLSIALVWWNADAMAVDSTSKFNQAHLKKFRTDLFDYYPPTVCALKALLGDQYQKIKDNEYKGGLSGMETPWEITGKDGDVIVSHCNFNNEDKRLLWVHPRGSVIVAIQRGNDITLYTNDRTVKDNLPKGVKMFIDTVTTGGARVNWKLPQGAGVVLPPTCTDSRMQAEATAYEKSTDGISADAANIKYMTFAQKPYVVFPKDKLARKVPVLKTPGPDSGGKSPYLVAGDMVQPVQTDFAVKPVKGYLNVYYRGVNGHEVLGWVKQEDLLPVSDSYEASLDANLAKLPAAVWFKTSLNNLNYPGRYIVDQSNKHRLKVEKTSKGLKATVSGQTCDGTAELNLVNSRVAQLPESSDDDRFDLYLFNNGIFLHSVNECIESSGPNFWAICYPESPKKGTN